MSFKVESVAVVCLGVFLVFVVSCSAEAEADHGGSHSGSVPKVPKELLDRARNHVKQMNNATLTSKFNEVVNTKDANLITNFLSTIAEQNVDSDVETTENLQSILTEFQKCTNTNNGGTGAGGATGTGSAAGPLRTRNRQGNASNRQQQGGRRRTNNNQNGRRR